MSKLFQTICALFFLMTWQLASAEAITNTKEGDKVSGIVTFSERHLFSNKKKADIPLPPGEWTVRLVEKVKSTHSDPVSGIMLALDKIENNLVIESINISAYDQNQRLWNVTCEPGISHQPNLGNYDSECFTLDLKTFMTDTSSDWQQKLKKKWNDAGISWSGNALTASIYIISPTFGHVGIFYSIPTARYLDDYKTNRESPLHSSKLNNADEKVKLSLPAIREWYQDYFKRVKEGVYKAKDNLPPSRLSAGMRSVVPDIEKLAANTTGATTAVVVAEASPKLKLDTPVKKTKNLVDLLDDDELSLPADWHQRASTDADEIEKGLEQLRIMEAEQEKLTRLAEETRTKEREKEKQSVVEGERKQAADLQAKRDAEKQLALETERKQAAELRALRESGDPLTKAWKDSGLGVSRLQPCPPKTPSNLYRNCFGFAKLENGVEFIGEFGENERWPADLDRGISIYPNGDKYVGRHYGMKKIGPGIYYFLADNPNKGMIFVGHFKFSIEDISSVQEQKWRKYGKGIYFDQNGVVIESGIYQKDILVERRYIDPSEFKGIPNEKIPTISNDARLRIEGDIAKEKAERQRAAAVAKADAPPYSKSGKPADEAYCRLQGWELRGFDKKCISNAIITIGFENFLSFRYRDYYEEDPDQKKALIDWKAAAQDMFAEDSKATYGMKADFLKKYGKEPKLRPKCDKSIPDRYAFLKSKGLAYELVSSPLTPDKDPNKPFACNLNVVSPNSTIFCTKEFHDLFTSTYVIGGKPIPIEEGYDTKIEGTISLSEIKSTGKKFMFWIDKYDDFYKEYCSAF